MEELMIKVDELIEKYGLSDVKEYIYKNLKKSVYLSIAEKDDYKVLGISRVGGYPDVPDKFNWPLTRTGEKMTFIAQLNLREVSISDENQILPKKGMLYFFMGIDEPAYDIEHKVIFSEEENLKFTKPEKFTVLEEEYELSFNPYKVKANSYIEIPNYAYLDCDQVEDTDSYYELQENLLFSFKNYIGKIFGYPIGQHDDSELEATLKIVANEKYNYTKKDKEKLISALNGDEKKADKEIEDMLMLLEIDTDYNVGFQWWDAGSIHFFIRKEDLINKNFHNTYLSLYSS
ncbi:YwqG family protein [Clostridium sp. SHJSY1]|uniref:YwqG family protein n=1 Tax=Clostridium sp. SHJSY1 TaxID=2942483 RepID=UPI0028755BE0|nr:YwqG family protein [Clostridium sp. SHJSY1]MDS0525124.1 YwqG family protein [Clostridium sp. SHJSY1]